MQVELVSSDLSSDFEEIDIEESPVIEYHSVFQSCWSRFSSQASVERDLSQAATEYGNSATQFLNRIWKWIRNREVILTGCAYAAAFLSACVGTAYLSLVAITSIYALSLSLGVALSEIFFGSTSFPTDSSWTSQYIVTPLIGLSVPLGVIFLCVGLCGAQLRQGPCAVEESSES